MKKSIVAPIFQKGLELSLAEDKTNEEQKHGYLRGGTCGVLNEERGTVAGKCHRLAFLRKEGVTVDPVTVNRKLMFRAGIGNEDLWYETLKRAWDGPILREEEVSTAWETRNGTPVTGRPDIVLCEYGIEKTQIVDPIMGPGEQVKEITVPKVGIELKLVSSLWTARDVLFEGRPKYDHLIQAGHYSWQLDIPFELWYTSRADFATNDMAIRALPDYGTEKYTRLAEYLDTGYYRKVMSRYGNLYGKRITEDEFNAGTYGYKEGQVYASPLKILPFAIGYLLDWNEEGLLTYTNVLTKETKSTDITRDRIRNYYEFVSTMHESKDLGPRPLTLKGDGTPGGYSQCQYCPLDSICDNKDFDTWYSKVKDFCND